MGDSKCIHVCCQTWNHVFVSNSIQLSTFKNKRNIYNHLFVSNWIDIECTVKGEQIALSKQATYYETINFQRKNKTYYFC
jgi:hypothetical protein